MAARIHTKASCSTRVLLVDDNSVGLMARRMVLEELGYEATGVTCPMEALDLFTAEPFDLVVTDYKMPGLNGKQLIAALREQVPSLPVILISGYVDALGLTEKSTGASVVIMKSANEVQHMVRAVTRLLTIKPARKPPASAAGRVRRKAASS